MSGTSHGARTPVLVALQQRLGEHNRFGPHFAYQGHLPSSLVTDTAAAGRQQQAGGQVSSSCFNYST
jgi:hypothetical protein